jgi:hypothetical protein
MLEGFIDDGETFFLPFFPAAHGSTINLSTNSSTFMNKIVWNYDRLMCWAWFIVGDLLQRGAFDDLVSALRRIVMRMRMEKLIVLIFLRVKMDGIRFVRGERCGKCGD